ncbi:class I SAM-dependent methyltransferase [Methylobacterium pseudosasicola]|uniref:Methyltransferase domain-containing protein n=1 Tax=Methylobacterium pseudosasicola TaxID=582667 RepID=A0A1I4MFF8_9HYPH|nr:class I SAM-dependent methyltransferase [Methylobacterium pseudosasicola]SFM01776.1 Methyltransferase domain-containing protein [Methylobacterium pseudosasicola]
MLVIKQSAGRFLAHRPALRSSIKELVELAFWRKTLWKSKGRFYNAHLVPFYTTFFGLDQAFYAGKRVLDVGCGPVGSLEWATESVERVGLDPLADSYVKLNRGLHKMCYVAAPSENIPFPNGRFDVVTMFNALDHVEDVDRTVAELKRVCAPGGTILLIVEINHPPTVTEPHLLGMDIVDKFDGFSVERSEVFGIRDDHNVYGSLSDRHPFPGSGKPGILCLRLTKKLN